MFLSSYLLSPLLSYPLFPLFLLLCFFFFFFNFTFADDAGYVREKHFDGCFLRNTGGPHRDQSHFTLLIYLNEGFDGGLFPLFFSSFVPFLSSSFIIMFLMLISVGETTFFPGGINSLHATEPTHKEVRVNPVSTLLHSILFLYLLIKHIYIYVYLSLYYIFGSKY